jgi:hypothetical protein
MNAGPDVERLIAGWLVEEAPGRAPDRILEAAGRVIDRTRQRRFVVAWREDMTGIRGLAAAAVLATVAIAGIVYFARPSLGPGGPPSPSPSALATPSAPPSPSAGPLMAGPLVAGTYIGPTLQVADIVAAVNADTTLTPADRTQVIDGFLGIRGKSTFSVIIDLRAGQMTETEVVDGVRVVGSRGRYAFPDAQTLVYTENNEEAFVMRFELAIDGESFTLHRTSAMPTAADEAVTRILFESGPFTLRP